jgi:hypothetical protein
MQLSQEEINLIASTPKNECWMCEEILNNLHGQILNDKFLKENPDIKEHLLQII